MIYGTVTNVNGYVSPYYHSEDAWIGDDVNMYAIGKILNWLGFEDTRVDIELVSSNKIMIKYPSFDVKIRNVNNKLSATVTDERGVVHQQIAFNTFP